MTIYDELREKLAIGFVDQILMFDGDGIAAKCDMRSVVIEAGYEFLIYTDPLAFRYYYELHLRNQMDQKIFVVVHDPQAYIPYDIRKAFYVVDINYASLFCNLDTAAIRDNNLSDMKLLYIAYQNHYGGKLSYKRTHHFVNNNLNELAIVNEYVSELMGDIRSLLMQEHSEDLWYRIASLWAIINHKLHAGLSDVDVEILAKEINTAFKYWMLEHYKGLSSNPISAGPVMMHRINDYIRTKSRKAVLLVIDGMSMENWVSLKQSLQPITNMHENYVFALIPSITSISRKAMFSGKLPVHHEHLFSLSDEKKLWVAYWRDNGYATNDIFYGRGFDVEIPYNTRIAGIVINHVDDSMHGQVFGSEGMNLNVSLFANRGQLKQLIDRLTNEGFDIFLTADHGNIEAVGLGKIKTEGLNTESTSQRARAYRDFADTDKIRNMEGVFQYPGYYLPKDYTYFICEGNYAFADKGKIIVCHGGMSLEEVIVPFIEIRGDKVE